MNGTRRDLHGSDGIRLAADIAGPASGKPVLLIHGSMQTRRGWRDIPTRIAATGRLAIAVDMRGHGESAWAADQRYGWDAQAADIEALLGEIGRPAALIGASVAGKAGLVVASRPANAALLRGLVLVDTVPKTVAEGSAALGTAFAGTEAGFQSPQAAAEWIARRDGREVGPSDSARLARAMRQDGAGRWHWHWDPAWFDRPQGIRMIESFELLEAAAARVTIPMLAIRGEHSSMVDAAGVAALQKLAPQTEQAVVAGAGHVIARDNAAALGDLLIAFLDRHGL